MRILQSITVPLIEITSIAKPETEPEANLARRSTEATTIKLKNEEILKVSKILSIIALRKKNKRIVKLFAKIVKVQTQKMQKVVRNLSKKKNN